MTFEDPIECYEAIGNSLVEAVREQWKGIQVEALLSGSSVDLLVEFEKPNGQIGNIPYIPMLARYFYDLGGLVSTEEKGIFRKCTFVLRPDGDFEVDFEY